MAGELLTRDDIVRGKKNFDAQNKYMTGSAAEQVTLPDGQKIKTRAGFEKEIEDKFPDSKAGLRDVGNSLGNVPEVTSDGIGLSGMGTNFCMKVSSLTTTLIDCSVNGYYRIFDSVAGSITDIPYGSLGGNLLNLNYDEKRRFQYFYPNNSNRVMFRSLSRDSLEVGFVASVWYDFYHSGNTKPYTTTTATSANVVVTATGELQRSTSSALFKKDIADIHIDDYRAALKAVRPVSYRSTDATSDRTDWSWYSFIAEELGALDKRLVQMDSTEFFEDTKEDGTPFINSRELPEGEYAANGINTNGIVALMVHINQQMLGDIEKLEDEKTQLKRRMTNLEKRMDAIDGPAAPAE